MFQLAKAIYFEMVEHILFLHKVELRYEYVLKGKVTNFVDGGGYLPRNRV